MDDKGINSTLPCVTFTRLLPAPPDTVWAHLTDTRLIPAWYGEDSKIEPQQGGTVRLMGGHVRGVVTIWQPPRRLIYTWNVFDEGAAPGALSPYPESYPTFELEARDGGTLLTFTHFPILEHFVAQNAMGWHTMLDMLAATLNGEPVADRSTFMRKNAALYGVDPDALVR